MMSDDNISFSDPMLDNWRYMHTTLDTPTIKRVVTSKPLSFVEECHTARY